MRRTNIGLVGLGVVLVGGTALGVHSFGFGRFSELSLYPVHVSTDEVPKSRAESIDDDSTPTNGGAVVTSKYDAMLNLTNPRDHTGAEIPGVGVGANGVGLADPSSKAMEEFRTALHEIEIERIASPEVIEDILSLQKGMSKEELALSMKELGRALRNVQRASVSGLPNPGSVVAVTRK